MKKNVSRFICLILIIGGVMAHLISVIVWGNHKEKLVKERYTIAMTICTNNIERSKEYVLGTLNSDVAGCATDSEECFKNEGGEVLNNLRDCENELQSLRD
ncbi:hypothetical protein ACFL1P_00730 [Patescibacteria group bacterium]